MEKSAKRRRLKHKSIWVEKKGTSGEDIYKD
jgi:hypothetical protein